MDYNFLKVTGIRSITDKIGVIVAVNKLDTWVRFLSYFLYEMSGFGI